MAGTVEGGKAAAITNKARYGEDVYSRIGAIGGKNGHTGGFAKDVPCYCDEIKEMHYKRNCAGARGGRISRRKKAGEY